MANLPPIPAKRYFTISEVALLCDVKPHVLRYWEQEFVQLRPMKRRGNRRYYQHHELLMVRRIRSLLYDEGFTIHGARNQLGSQILAEKTNTLLSNSCSSGGSGVAHQDFIAEDAGAVLELKPVTVAQVRHELLQLRSILAL